MYVYFIKNIMFLNMWNSNIIWQIFCTLDMDTKTKNTWYKKHFFISARPTSRQGKNNPSGMVCLLQRSLSMKPRSPPTQEIFMVGRGLPESRIAVLPFSAKEQHTEDCDAGNPCSKGSHLQNSLHSQAALAIQLRKVRDWKKCEKQSA